MAFQEISVGEIVSDTLSEKEEKGYKVRVGANQKLTIRLDGPPEQDFDLYVKYGDEATLTHWDFRQITASEDETLTVGPTKEGSYCILIYAYRGSGKFSLSTEILFEEVELTYGQQVQGKIEGGKEAVYYLLKSDAGQRLIVNLSGPLDADFDLYVKYGKRPTNNDYDWKSISGSSQETITIDTTQKGSYYLMVFSYRGSGEFTLAASSGFKPSALIISSKERLLNKYGQSAFNQIEQKINNYIQALNNSGLSSMMIYVDDASRLSAYGLTPVDPKNPAKIKELIDSLDKKLNPTSFLILGGHEIIPFHSIANPCGNDGDTIVYSDNPYASRDEDVLIPERSLGRLPDDNSNSADFFISLLETVISRVKRARKSSFGYSAAVWQGASVSVYGKIKDDEELKLSPPVIKNSLQTEWINQKGYFYFNLHGSEDSANWYGQEGSNYPVAFSPENLANAGVENAIICTEACYGANIIDKNVDEAISLKYLEKKAACFVGSTKIAYGPSVPPNTDADLIVLKFFERIKTGFTFGEAFLKAKQDFAAESVSRKGYLDKTEEKTLLEFVMFGDPLLKMEEIA